MNNDWEHFGEEIKQTIQDAIDTKDYSRLNQMVSDTVNHAMDVSRRELKTVAGTEIRRPDSHYMEIKRIAGNRSGAENQGMPHERDVGNEKL